jgi:hypothetical protein
MQISSYNMIIYVIFAIILYDAFFASRFSCATYLSSMEYKPVAE